MKHFADLLEALRTPHKLGRLAVAPSGVAGEFDSHAVDVPFPFFHDGCHQLFYTGWDGVGYRTGRATSTDLRQWSKAGMVLDRGGPGAVTEFNACLTSLLRDNALYSRGDLRQVGGRYIGTYHAYPQPGYETGPAVIGLCVSDDLRRWEVLPPALRPEDGAPWEAGGLYKSWLMEADGTYYLFYNAKDREVGQWHEQIGVATSTDLEHWERDNGNPVPRHGGAGAFDERFASDPCVLRHRDWWVMFYFGLDARERAQDSVACSTDLLHWEKSNEILVAVGPPGAVDSRYAHKPGMIAKDGRLYHFYCAVRPSCAAGGDAAERTEIRGISLAHS